MLELGLGRSHDKGLEHILSPYNDRGCLGVCACTGKCFVLSAKLCILLAK